MVRFGRKVLAATLSASMVLAMTACGSGSLSKTTEKAAETTTAAETAKETTAGDTEEPAGDTEEPAEETAGAVMPKASGEKLVIGTLANWVGLPAWYAYAEGYYDEVGLDVEIVNFGSQGTLVNEAMAADECDIAVSGMASVYALSTGMYKYIGDGCLTISGETLYGRPDDAIYKAGADANGVYGSPDVLKDAVILGPMNTTAQMNAIAYMQYFGIDANSFTFTNLDYSSALAAFESGQGDLIAVNPTYAAILAGDGYVQVSDFTQVSPQDIIDAVYCQNEVAEDRAEDVELFLYCYYKACQDMLNNQDNRVAVAYKWYVDEGLDYKEQDVIDECSLKSYFTLDTVDSGDYLLGSFMNYAAEFLLANEKVTEDDVANVKASIDNSFVTSIKSWAAAE